MVKKELIDRSPLRVFEKSIQGGVGKGNIGVVASKKGVGKTACLTHIAVDKLLRDRRVLHVSFAGNVDHIINWYEDIFREIAKKRDLEEVQRIHDEIIKNRVIMNFSFAGTTTEQILGSIKAMITEGHFPADSIIVDGYDFEHGTLERFQKVSAFAKEMQIEVWYSASLKGEQPKFNAQGIPVDVEPYLDAIDVLINLRYEGEYVHLEVAKNHDEIGVKDLQLSLDPKTLLIAE
ncbi:hypothetical protein [Sediminispirochaeta smaragdinae]|jgi:hypothetical protein|uniref:Cytoplasmic protein n=1 Tax=Sediminispirochaeta smaragdinae (strain DSM 11293 / JCM 15392 / SEBR 4228) TaxID=573413 RepID=E1R9N6_SEDSS|nr:hypothetical protein [Sediminispirochaeta smaragdinae]ADK83205.1 conserved hypothetical protein [Sediminispirochaeta smaragdinae DSM 11293]